MVRIFLAYFLHPGCTFNHGSLGLGPHRMPKLQSGKSHYAPAGAPGRGGGVGGGARLGRDIYWMGIYTGSGYILDRDIYWMGMPVTKLILPVTYCLNIG